ncbi:MAG: metallophosphoesterase [Candidatus Thermoplasmatota archaeon]
MRIAHVSDIHCHLGTDFNEKIYNKACSILNDFKTDFIFISGDLTTNGLLVEYELAKEKLKNINGDKVLVPGNHDERNLGFKLFPEFFGKPSFIYNYDDITFIGLASSEPDKD